MMDTQFFQSVLNDLKARKERVINGKFNCVPMPFPRFRRFFPGIEKGKYMILTANQKVGKSKLCDFMFIYEPLFATFNHESIHIKILYFTLEMTKKEKYNEFLCHLLWRLDKINISPTQLKSTDRDHPVDDKILELLESERYQKYIQAFENMVEFIDDVKHPTGIMAKCKEYAMANGHFTYKEGLFKDNETGELKTTSIRDEYIDDDPEKYTIIIIDNAANISNESGMKKSESIDKLSKYLIEIRNTYKFVVTLVQHQAQAQEGTENFKLNRIKPSSDGLGDCKTTSRDFLHTEVYLHILNNFIIFKELVLLYMHETLIYKLSLNHVNLGKSGNR